MSAHDRLKKMVLGRDITIHVSEGIEMRVRAWMDRANEGQFKLDAFECNGGKPIWDLNGEGAEEDFEIALDVLIRKALEDDEKEHGLRGADWGEIVPEEEAAESVRRWLESRRQGQ
jgi:predicted transcriptional regulator